MDRTLFRLLIAIYLTAAAIISSAYGSIIITTHSLPSGIKKYTFSTALLQMDKSLEANIESCDFNPQKPNFTGLRLSEISCLDYIWYIKHSETRQKLGRTCPEHRISSGVPVNLQEYSHMSAIGWKDVKNRKWSFKCGGSLISELFVLTAAHCEHDALGIQPQIVRLGVVDVGNQTLIDDGFGVDINIKEFKKHPKYKFGYKNYDVALIKLETKVQFSNNILPACLLKQYDVKSGIVTGWGAVSNENVYVTSDVLLKGKVYILNKKDCQDDWRQKRYHWKIYFKDEQLCAIGDTRNKTDICAGDSGGPLQTKLHLNTNKSIHNIVGIISFSSKCGDRNFPSVYTRVHYHIKWIEREVWGSKFKSDDVKTLKV